MKFSALLMLGLLFLPMACDGDEQDEASCNAEACDDTFGLDLGWIAPNEECSFDSECSGTEFVCRPGAQFYEHGRQYCLHRAPYEGESSHCGAEDENDCALGYTCTKELIPELDIPLEESRIEYNCVVTGNPSLKRNL